MIVENYHADGLNKVVYNKILASAGAVSTKPLSGNVVVLRVVDPISDMRVWSSLFVDFKYWFMLGVVDVHHQLPEARAWLGRQMSNPMLPLSKNPWGLCGINYGMGEAKAYSITMEGECA